MEKILLIGYEHHIPDAQSVIFVESMIGQQQKFFFSTKERRLWITNYFGIQKNTDLSKVPTFFVTYIPDISYRRDKKITKILE